MCSLLGLRPNRCEGQGSAAVIARACDRRSDLAVSAALLAVNYLLDGIDDLLDLGRCGALPVAHRLLGVDQLLV